MTQSNNRFSARNLEVRTVELQLATDFLNENHRSGATREKTVVSLGLFREQELLAVIQFCYPRTSAMRESYSSELLRLAFKKGVRIPGGASKLIRHYIREYRPADFFTYQDTSGEATAVYEHAGMKLVSQAKRKQYLVAPGKTLESGSRKEVLGMPYATRYGPDRILGTKLGEIYREDGTRKSNKDIFLEELGWHIEETSGDRVYEWVDPNRTYYTYKITATDSDKYYYGVSHVKKANASIEDCLNDGYYGSGGKSNNNKFSNWKIRHRSKLVKEVLNLHSRKANAFAEEKSLVSDAYKNDQFCLNSSPGGRFSAPSSKFKPRDNLKYCIIHAAETMHIGESCRKCAMKESRSLQSCEVHGESVHYGGVCKTCVSQKRVNKRSCPKHGVTTHLGKTCTVCVGHSTIQNKECDIHGACTHQGNSCLQCVFDKRITMRLCETHGMTKFYGESCCKCSSASRLSKGNCPLHGEITLLDGECSKCKNKGKSALKICSIHGETLHQGSSCPKCVQRRVVSMRECSTHGISSHHGDKCSKCVHEKTNKLGFCATHGEVKFQGSKCSKCTNKAIVREMICSVHGKTKHRGNSCYKCVGARRKAKLSNKEQ